MKIHNPNTGEVLETPCHGCMCHELPVMMGKSLDHGCCRECGCPKNLEGFEYLKNKQNPEQKAPWSK